MAEKRVIEYEAASAVENDDWLLIDGVTEGTRKARPSTVTAELGQQVTNIATIVGGLTQVAMGHGQSFAPSYDESTSYDVGDLVMKYNCLYKCTAPTTGAWDSSKWQLATVAEQLEESGKIDDVQVNGVSVVTDKVANIDLTDMQEDIDSKVADVTIGGESILDNNKVANLDFLASYGEASGSIASFNDGAAMPLKSLKVGIEAVQSGTGDPSPTNVRPITGWSAVNVYDGPTTEPLDATTYTTQLKDRQGNPLTCYGGTLDVVSGELVVDKVMLTVDENSTIISGSGGLPFRIDLLTGAKASSSASALTGVKCNFLKEVAQSSSWGVDGTFSRVTTDAKIVYFKVNSEITTIQQLKTFLQSNNLQFVYELANPITIQLTPTMVKSLLGTNNIWADSGEILECKYVRDNSAVINDLIARVTALENE